MSLSGVWQLHGRITLDIRKRINERSSGNGHTGPGIICDQIGKTHNSWIIKESTQKVAVIVLGEKKVALDSSGSA